MFKEVWKKYSDNCWVILLQQNYELLTEKNKQFAKIYIDKHSKSNYYNEFVNVFCLDGWSDNALFQLAANLKLLRDVGNRLIIPKEIDLCGRTIFYNHAEGFATDDFFDFINLIVELFNFKNKVVYCNCSYNINDMYLNYCERRNIKPLITCYYNNNTGYNSVFNSVYAIPDDYIPIKSFDEKKLFCSFNWNAWPHRLGLIALLHYYDLIDDGFITSPGEKKYGYNKEIDYYILYNSCQSYIDKLPEFAAILEKLPTIKGKYPLVIDDRSKYTFTDEPLYDIKLKIPLFTARKNSLFEIITETKFVGEHFFSEKTYTPISLHLPFLMVSSYKALTSLRKIGYKTFSPYIDESYDLIEDDQLRLHTIVKEVDRLKKLRVSDPTQFKKLYDNLMTICKYNAEIFVNESYRPSHYRGRIDRYVSL